MRRENEKWSVPFAEDFVDERWRKLIIRWEFPFKSWPICHPNVIKAQLNRREGEERSIDMISSTIRMFVRIIGITFSRSTRLRIQWKEKDHRRDSMRSFHLFPDPLINERRAFRWTMNIFRGGHLTRTMTKRRSGQVPSNASDWVWSVEPSFPTFFGIFSTSFSKNNPNLFSSAARRPKRSAIHHRAFLQLIPKAVAYPGFFEHWAVSCWNSSEDWAKTFSVQNVT